MEKNPKHNGDISRQIMKIKEIRMRIGTPSLENTTKAQVFARKVLILLRTDMDIFLEKM